MEAGLSLKKQQKGHLTSNNFDAFEVEVPLASASSADRFKGYGNVSSPKRGVSKHDSRSHTKKLQYEKIFKVKITLQFNH